MAGNLHQSEFRQWQDVVASAVVAHHLAHMVVESLAMLGLRHVDEVDYDDTTQVAKPQLACNLIGGTKVHLKGIALLVGITLGAVARVDVDNMKRLCAFYNNVGATLERHGFAKR